MSGLLRNLGGICDPRLYSRSYLGTKNLTSSYIEEVSQTLQFLSAEKLESFFADTKQSFGSTALLLQGGASFGLFHLGVIKALNEHKLLPRIISGSSIGALIAALVCIHTDEELPVRVASYSHAIIYQLYALRVYSKTVELICRPSRELDIGVAFVERFSGF